MTEVALLGEASIPAGFVVESSEVGGLSALAYDSTTFQYVSWPRVASAFEDELLVDASYNPRYPMRVILPAISGE